MPTSICFGECGSLIELGCHEPWWKGRLNCFDAHDSNNFDIANRLLNGGSVIPNGFEREGHIGNWGGPRDR